MEWAPCNPTGRIPATDSKTEDVLIVPRQRRVCLQNVAALSFDDMNESLSENLQHNGPYIYIKWIGKSSSGAFL